MFDDASQSAFGGTVTTSRAACPACEASGPRIVYAQRSVPTNQVKLRRTREAAIGAETGDLELAHCAACGFVWNAAFDPAKVHYDDDYECTQAVSPTFNAFHASLAEKVAEKFDLAGKTVIDVGCGQGEFLALLCDHGIAKAIGFDPTLKVGQPARPEIDLRKEWYDESQFDLRPDFVASKMVMEHIPDPKRFVTMLRGAIGDRPDAVTFHMMPILGRILDVTAFWDVYYEHCAYFSLGSLARAFREARFDPIELWADFGGQYGVIAARPGEGTSPPLDAEESTDELAARLDAFAAEAEADKKAWKAWIERESAAGRRVVFWGGGSKAVAFFTSIGVRHDGGVSHCIDINPARKGTFVAGTGQEITTPDALPSLAPDHLVVLSPIYTDEIKKDLAKWGVAPRIYSIEDGPPA